MTNCGSRRLRRRGRVVYPSAGVINSQSVKNIAQESRIEYDACSKSEGA